MSDRGGGDITGLVAGRETAYLVAGRLRTLLLMLPQPLPKLF